jgi:hypothetical protein
VVPDSKLKRIITSYRINYWLISTEVLFFAFIIYSFTVSKGVLAATLELFKEHLIFDIIKISILLLAVLIMQAIFGKDNWFILHAIIKRASN